MNIWHRWAERIYAETDLGRSVATSAAGLIGLVVYLITSDLAIASFSAITVFPIVRVLASSVHSKTARLTKLRAQKDGLQGLYERLSPDEKEVVSAFVVAGGSVMTWGQVNKSDIRFSAIESLMQRSLLHTSVTADGFTETFVLDQDIFDVGQDNWKPPF